MKKIASVLLLIAFCVSAFCACGENKDETGPKPALENVTIMHDTKFGGIYFNSSIDDFNALGFKYGDSVDIVFSNGKKLEDLPYYNGYYVDIDEPLLVAYPGYPYIRAGYNYGSDMWQALVEGNLLNYYSLQAIDSDEILGSDPWLTLEVKEDVTATIVLRESGKYLSVQNARDIHYSDVQGDRSNEVFGNFRAVNMGALKENILYRSASPCNNEHKRAATVDALAKNAGIRFIINLSEDDAEVLSFFKEKDYDSPHFRLLYQQDKVAALGLSANFKSESFGRKLAEGLTKAAQNDGPFLIHCVEGKDRTGYVLMILEALCGATYKEIVDDYMLTYDNYYGITESSDKARYDVIKEKNLDAMIAYVTGVDAKSGFEGVDMAKAAEDYLIRIGMTRESVDLLKTKLTGK